MPKAAVGAAFALAIVLGVGVAAPSPALASAPDASCSIPCGPVPAIIMIQVDPPPREANLSEHEPSYFEGTVEYHVPIDEDAEGFVFDPTKRPVIRFSTPRTVAWVSMAVDPPEIEVPIDDPRYLGPDGYRYRHPINVTATADEQPSPDQLRDELREHGRYPVLLAADSDASLVEVGGALVLGIMESHGVREFRFLPAAHWEVADPPNDKASAAGLEATRLEGSATVAPAAGMAVIAMLAALAAAVTAAVQRRLRP